MNSLLVVYCCDSGGVYGELCLSLLNPLQCAFFFSFTQCVGVAKPASEFLSEGIIPYVTVDLVCVWEEVISGTFCIAILN